MVKITIIIIIIIYLPLYYNKLKLKNYKNKNKINNNNNNIQTVVNQTFFQAVSGLFVVVQLSLCPNHQERTLKAMKYFSSSEIL